MRDIEAILKHKKILTNDTKEIIKYDHGNIIDIDFDSAGNIEGKNSDNELEFQDFHTSFYKDKGNTSFYKDKFNILKME